jgi:hypothetical protein
MPARHRHHHSSTRRKSFTITLESCSRSSGIRVHDALETVNTIDRNMQHGNGFRADGKLTDLMFEVDGAIEEDREARRPVHLVLKKLVRALEEFTTYIDNNASAIVHYGERHRCGERISSGFVESTINRLVAKRFINKQRMRWTPRGAHLLLQIRVQGLNDDLHSTFKHWYPDLQHQQEETLAA